MDKLYIIIPAYNEEENIERVVKEWYPIIEQHNGNGGSRLVVIDDGSKDSTYCIVKECAKSRPFIEPVTKSNSGHGSSVLFGYHYAIEKGADYIFQTDSDGQTVPAEFKQFWEQRGNYDMIIGYRNKREDGFIRVVITKVLKFTIRLCFGVSVKDANTPFRLMRADTLKHYLNQIPNDFNLSNVLISVIYAKRKLAVKYIPITFHARQGGVNSINLKKIIGIGRRALKDFRIINEEIKW